MRVLCLIGCLDPALAFNDGMRDAVHLTFAPRTITNAEPPAPVSNYQMVNLKLVDVILEALAHFHPARAIANAGSSSALTIAWAKGRPGQSTMQYEIMGSAYGGGMGHDGTSATATHLSNLHITPIEILESEFPCRITRFELVADSGGPGQWRGGLSLEREYELLENATVIRRYDKSRFPPGLAGGKAGQGARFVIRVGSSNAYETPSSGRYETRGERFLLQSAGGGYGDPGAREAALAAMLPGVRVARRSGKRLRQHLMAFSSWSGVLASTGARTRCNIGDQYRSTASSAAKSTATVTDGGPIRIALGTRGQVRFPGRGDLEGSCGSHGAAGCVDGHDGRPFSLQR